METKDLNFLCEETINLCITNGLIHSKDDIFLFLDELAERLRLELNIV